ncbi:GNAT family N-acetyltransferase [Aliterella atlantica]|uniref:GNAT family acetyltransferase n=1 Tax=Aliterella atlantica CENA595 TaxID=1618023 RepID=A0A0D8ZN90_9CYAN|nr:GNAT family acetyltransferase [Aliterella atlantica CENA595]
MIQVVQADLSLPAHAKALVQLMDAYALDPMGSGQGLPDYVLANLPSELAKRKSAHVILAFVDAEPAGLVVCLEGFSTFACKPLLNIHDVIVASPYRGRGLSKLLLHKAEEIAFDLGCCKLTLEVLEGNYVAQAAYRAFGFSGYELNPQMGKALFWEKKLTQVTEPAHSLSN